MSILNSENINDNFKKPEVLRRKLNTLDEKLPPILDDFKKYYVFFHKNPEYPEYQSLFENIKGNLNTTNSELFLLSNQVDLSSDKINKQLFHLNVLIQKEKDKNRKLKRKLGIVDEKNNAANELISDYKNIYESAYLQNWALFFSILIIGSSLTKMSK